MSVIIGPKEREEIEAAIERAKANPIPLSVLKQVAIKAPAKQVVTHAELSEINLSLRPKSQSVLLPFGISVCYSVEQQPQGFCGHLSIMKGDGKTLVDVPIAMFIAGEFGMTLPFEGIWIEEVDPNSYAVNMVHCHAPTRIEGSA